MMDTVNVWVLCIEEGFHVRILHLVGDKKV